MSDRKIDKLGKLYEEFRCIMLTSRNFSSTEKNIQDFMNFYRTEFSWATVLPKMHVMEDHVIPWLRRFHIGAGLMGEQGAESIHALIMKLEREFRGIKDELDSLKYIVTEQSLYTAPSLSALRPPVKRRKLDDSSSDDSSDEEEEEEEDNEEAVVTQHPSILVSRS